MKANKKPIQDLEEIRLMMERSSRFLTLSGWSGILAGIYALVGVYMANKILGFNPDIINYTAKNSSSGWWIIVLIAIVVLSLALGTAIFLSRHKAVKKGEGIWNAASRQLLANMAVPLVSGGALLLVLISKDLIGLIMPLTLIFYGLALYSAGKFTYTEVKYLGLIQIGLGVLAVLFINYSLIIWAIGFGFLHIVYGVYMYFRYER